MPGKHPYTHVLYGIKVHACALGDGYTFFAAVWPRALGADVCPHDCAPIIRRVAWSPLVVGQPRASAPCAMMGAASRMPYAKREQRCRSLWRVRLDGNHRVHVHVHATHARMPRAMRLCAL